MPKIPPESAPRADSKLESWSFKHWPANVWPHDGKLAQRFVRQNYDSLVAEGAVTRLGRAIVILAMPFQRWMQKQSYRVRDYAIPPNTPKNLNARERSRRQQRVQRLKAARS